MGAFDFLKSAKWLKEAAIGIVVSLFEMKAYEYADEQVIEVLGGLRNQGFATETDDAWIITCTIPKDMTGEYNAYSSDRRARIHRLLVGAHVGLVRAQRARHRQRHLPKWSGRVH